MSMTLSYHESIKTLPIANFDEISKTDNLGYLYDAKFLDCKNLEPKIELIKAWNNIQEEYKEVISKRSTAKDVINKKCEYGFYYTENMKVKLICNQLMRGIVDDEFIDMLEESGYRINQNKDIKKEAERIIKQSDNFLTILRAIEQDIDNLKTVGKEIDIEELKGLFRKHLQLGDVNIYTTSVKEWLYYEDELIKYLNTPNKA